MRTERAFRRLAPSRSHYSRPSRGEGKLVLQLQRSMQAHVFSVGGDLREVSKFWVACVHYSIPFSQQFAMRVSNLIASLAFLAIASLAHVAMCDEKIAYETIANVLKEYCAGCHSGAEPEGDFSLSSYQALTNRVEDGRVIVPGKPAESKLFQLVTGTSEPAMPPEDEPQPSNEEITQLKNWILQGAEGPTTSAPIIASPSLKPAKTQFVGSACNVGKDTIAIGKLSRVELRNVDTNELIWEIATAGKVNSIRTQGELLVVSSGIAGIHGEVLLVDSRDGKLVQQLVGHTDIVYCASLSADRRWVASGSYDRTVILWNADTGAQVSTLTGHNGAIYDLDFSPNSLALATASADQTVKIWKVESGERLDTFGQPEGEMRCVRFSPDGKSVFAAGEDRQIRKWQLVSIESPAISPMLYARYAHEEGVLQLEFADERRLLTASADQTVKMWDADTLNSYGQVAATTDVPVAICTQGNREINIVELTGSRTQIARHEMDALVKIAHQNALSSLEKQAVGNTQPERVDHTDGAVAVVAEREPNGVPETATSIQLPASITGVIQPLKNSGPDYDLYRFSAVAGQTWMIDVEATGSEKRLDSQVDVLHTQGDPVLRTRLQALRESYFTFRGKDSFTSDDFRLHKWEDMELDEYLYSNGEVTRLWHYPRGPDSGFRVYPGAGSRHTFFGTTAVTHALGETAYVVRELESGEEPLPNGLPVFSIYFENDDDPLRQHGRDSRLEFVAPTTGEYVLRIGDAREFGGADFEYFVTIRRPNPDFVLTVSGTTMSMPVGSGREWKVQALRKDGLDAPIVIQLEGVPDGFVATSPLVIEAGQMAALGTIFATPSAKMPPADPAVTSDEVDGGDAKKEKHWEVQLVASCEVDGRRIEHRLEETINLSLSDDKELQFTLVDSSDRTSELKELPIRPGQTVSARVIVNRIDESPISFGKDDSGRNLPHGAYVDNIGLNGLLIPGGQTEREFFITAAEKLKPGRRQFHLQTESKGKATSPPIWLNVLPPANNTAGR